MPTSDVKVTPGTGKNVATYSVTEDAESKEIQRVGLNKSDGTEIGTTSNPVVTSPTGTLAVYFDQSEPTVKVKPGSGTLLVAFDRANPNVTANAGTGTFNVQLDPGHTIGNIGSVGSVTGSIGIYFDRGSPTIIASPTGTTAVYFDKSNPSVNVGTPTIAAITNTVAVYFDRGNPTITANAGTGTFNVQLDPGHMVGNIGSVNSIATTINVQLDPGHTLGNIGTVTTLTGITNTVHVDFQGSNPNVKVNYGSGTFLVAFDRANPTVTANAGTGTMTVTFDSSKGFLQGINTSVGVYFDRAAPAVSIPGSVAVYFDRGNPAVAATFAGTMAVYFDKSNPTITVGNFSGIGYTASIFATSGSCSSAALGGNTIITPSANYSFKIFAFALSTTVQTGIYVRFTNGASSTPVEYWRYALQAPTQGIAGANLAVTPPGFLWATGVSTTLALVLDSASLVHYSISYFKESA